jgi:nitrogen PTS system EIIA component
VRFALLLIKPGVAGSNHYSLFIFHYSLLYGVKTMKLSSLLDPDLVFCDIDAVDKSEVISTLLAAIEAKSPGVDVVAIKEALAEREKLSSIVMAPGIAFPHARVEGIDDFFITIATSKSGISFGDEKINFIALFIIKESASNLYLKTMAAMSKLLSVSDSLDKLVAIIDSSEFVEKVNETAIEVEPTIRADDIMSENIVSLMPEQSLKEVADIFVDTGHSTLPVVNKDNKFIGLLRSIDLLKMGLPNYLSEMSDVSFMANYEPFENLLKAETTLTVDECYIKDVKTYMDHAPVIQIAIGLIHSEEHLAPIIDSDGCLIGLITITDFITKILRA